MSVLNTLHLKLAMAIILMIAAPVSLDAQISTYTKTIGGYKGPVKKVTSTNDQGVNIDCFNPDGTIQKNIKSTYDTYIVFEWKDSTFIQKFYRKSDDSYVSSSILKYNSTDDGFYCELNKSAYRWDFNQSALYCIDCVKNTVLWKLKSELKTDKGYYSVMYDAGGNPLSKVAVKTYNPDKYGNFTCLEHVSGDGIRHKTNIAYEYYEDDFSVQGPVNENAGNGGPDDILLKAGIRMLLDKNYDSALKLYSEVAEIFYRQGETGDRKYLEAIKGMADCYEMTGDSKSAIKYYNKLLKYSDLWQSDYACLKLSALYQKAGNENAAIQVLETGISKYREADGRWNNNYYRIFKDLFYLYYSKEDFTNAIRVGEELTGIIGSDLPRWSAIGLDLATVYMQTGEAAKARVMLDRILSIYAEDPDGYSVTHKFNIALGYLQLGETAYNTGDYENAISLCLKARNLMERAGKVSTVNYISVKKFLAMSYSELGDMKSATGYAYDAYNLAVQYGADYNIVASALVNLVAILYQAGYSEQAENMLSVAEGLNINKDNKASLYNMLSVACRDKADYEAALKYGRLAVGLCEDPVFYHNLAINYAENQNFNEAAACLLNGWELAANELYHLFMQNRENDRHFAWERYRLLIKAPVELLWQTNNSEIVKYAYNSLLLTKSIQLATSVNFRSAVYNSGNTVLINLYDKWLGMSPDNDLYKETELELLSIINGQNGLGTAFNIRWNNIRDGLDEKGLAVEFFRIVRDDTGEEAYFALLLRHDWDAPKVVNICLDSAVRSLDGMDIDQLYTSSMAGNMIWAKILQEAQVRDDEIENIYFAPDGGLYSIAIEYLTVDGERMNEHYNMHRLSSTREIVAKTEYEHGNHAALFGGIDYNIAPEEMEFYSYTLSGDRTFNNVWNYLPGTQKEIDDINEILTGSGYSVDIHSGGTCIEESIKNYSAQAPDILHIATHGFYLPTGSTSSDGGVNLLRCGLAFAGANNTTLGYNDIPEGIDDGILSADEISRMDLRGTFLVVLSACQTGLGDVEDEGVFGLQRAFKKAGAGSILMSLWNVDDTATQKFMSFFYQALVSGMSKHNAFAYAQEKIRQLDFIDSSHQSHSGSDPYYWASFVLLD